MANTDITRNKIKSKLSAIKKISDNPKLLADNSYDLYKDQLESTSGVVKKNINDFTSKIKGGTQNKKDIFADILDISNSFLGTEKEDPVNTKTGQIVKSKIFKYTKESVRRTLQTSKQTINDELQKALFQGAGLCAPGETVGTTSVDLSPKAFDFINMLKIDPDSTTGKLMYENETINPANDIKFNKVLYENFDSGSPYSFQTKDGTSLFTMTWNATTQEYNLTSIDSSGKISDFIDNYYNSIEYSNIEDVFKTAMQMVLGGDSVEPSSFTDAMKNLNRLISKIFCLCGSPLNNEQPLLNNATNQLSEDEYDIENYFDFDDIEGIDIDEEEARLRRVLKFVDCNNFETNFNSNHTENYAYYLNSSSMTADENVMNTLNKAARDAYEESGGSVSLDGFLSSLLNSYILKMPRALISNILSPKIFFPIAVSFKLIKGETTTAKDLMKSQSNLFYNIIKAIYWKFIKEFWGFIKKDLIKFIKDTASKILTNKLKKIKSIIQILISIIKKILENNIGSCTEIFGAILQLITSSLNKSINIPIPGMLLVLSEALPGYSNDRAYMNIMERLESSGINTGPLYGTENKLPALIKSVIDGHAEEFDTNSFVKIGLKPAIIPAAGGAAAISPLIEGVGKVF